MSLAAGSRLDSYEIIGLLGAGGMGEVYRAHDLTLKREVAIKVRPADCAGDPERLRRFEREAQSAAALNHPNIVSIFHIGVHEGTPYIVTELLQGVTLRDRLGRGPMRLAEVLDFGEQIALGRWFQGNAAWVIGGLVLFSVVPFTLIVVFPTNKRLESEGLGIRSAEAEQLLRRWGRLHAIRTILSGIAFLVFLSSQIAKR